MQVEWDFTSGYEGVMKQGKQDNYYTAHRGTFLGRRESGSYTEYLMRHEKTGEYYLCWHWANHKILTDQQARIWVEKYAPWIDSKTMQAKEGA